jgi:hypothetical protein
MPGVYSYGEFTYFQTFVTVPGDEVVTEFTISLSRLDDGVRVTIFNSEHPDGAVIPGSYVYVGGSGTSNLADFVVAGEENRVVITLVDDCCSYLRLERAVVVFNGERVGTGCDSADDCGDGNVCTQDVCHADGSCSNPPVSCDDGNACTLDQCNPASGCFSENQCPDCSAAGPTVSAIWPPNHKFVGVGIQGITDPQGQPTSIRIDDIAQDEPTNTFGDGNTCADGAGLGSSTAQVRAERSGTQKVPGNGRVYHISFTATDPDGYSCTGAVRSCVPHDQGNRSTCLDEGPRYDSLVCAP